VGDRGDSCGSLACEGGTAGACVQQVEAAREGMAVTCAKVVSAPAAPAPAPAPVNHYRKAPRVGGWGGWCTCPDGQRYNVGDNYDGCGSLACEGGSAGECAKVVVPARDGMKVTCAATSA